MSSKKSLNKISVEEVKKRILALPKEKIGKAAYFFNSVNKEQSQSGRFVQYKYEPAQYITKFLKWTPWDGIDEEHPGQAQILKACADVMRAQEEKDLFEVGAITEDKLTCYKPGEKIKFWIRVESGNGIGKTKSASGILNWFLDCFKNSTIFTFAPGGKQAQYALWSEIGGDRAEKGLPGRILETEIKVGKKNFAAHRTFSDGHGKGEERIKGKHAPFQLFILDEADGIPKFVFDGVKTMTSGGHSLVVMFANPKSRASMFHRIKANSNVQTFRVSSLFHPNVVQGEGIVPGAVKRDFVEQEIESHCEIIHDHNDDECKCRKGCLCSDPVKGFECDGEHKKLHREDDFTFELIHSVLIGEVTYQKGTIFKPDEEFMTVILGITPPNSADNTLIPVGRYEAACKRVPIGGDKTKARVGIDAARFGKDSGTIYIRWQDVIWKTAELFKQKGSKYFDIIKTELLKLKEKGVTSVHVRIDAGYGSAIIERLESDHDLITAFPDYQIFEVSFNGNPYAIKEYSNIVTEMYAETAESLKGLCILNPSEKLELDLCDREYKYRNKGGREVKILEEKDEFKKRKKHSPDDGDGFVLACAPDFCFNKANFSIVSTSDQTAPSVKKSDPLGNIMNRLLNQKN